MGSLRVNQIEGSSLRRFVNGWERGGSVRFYNQFVTVVEQCLHPKNLREGQAV